MCTLLPVDPPTAVAHKFTAGDMGRDAVRRIRRAGIVSALVVLAGCTQGGLSPSALNEEIGISYGTIQTVTPVKVSPTGEIAGSVAGGLLGLALTAGHSGGSMLLGAAGGT